MPANHTHVVLVHGGWADGSSWSKVIGPLEAEGVNVVAAPHRFMAERMGANARERPVDHTPMVTAPGEVIDIILDAVRDVETTA
jgi:hypothetical protein